MKTGERVARKRVVLILTLASVTLLVVWGQLHTYNVERVIPQKPEVVINSVVAPAASLPMVLPGNTNARVFYIDPNTGARLSHPAPGQPVISLGSDDQYRISKEASDLVMTPLPGGGYDMDHQGRFQVLELLLTNPDGTTRRGHTGESAVTAEEGQQKEKKNEQ